MQKKLKKNPTKIEKHERERERERESTFFDGKTMYRMEESDKFIVRVWE